MQRRPSLRLRQNCIVSLTAVSRVRGTNRGTQRTNASAPSRPTTPTKPVAIDSEDDRGDRRDEQRRDRAARVGERAPRAEERRGVGPWCDIGAEGEQDAARQAVADAEDRGEHREPHRGAVEVVREGERDEARAHEHHRRQGRPQPAEAVHHLPARVEEGEVDRARDAHDERDRLRVESDRDAPQRQHDLARGADGREGCRGQPEPRRARRRNRHIVRNTPTRSAVGIEPVTASPVSSAIVDERPRRRRRAASRDRGRAARAARSRRGTRRRTRSRRARRRRSRAGRPRRTGR